MTTPEALPAVLEAARHGIDYPDIDAEHAARARQDQLTKPSGALGMLEELSIWAAGVQGQCPPHAFERTRVVVFAGDHGIAAAGVSAYPTEVTAQMVANIVAGGAGGQRAGRGAAGVGVQVLDLSVAADTDPTVSRYKVRRSSGRIDREDALSPDEVDRALTAGAAVADAEIDSGAQLLIAGDMGIGNTTPASVLISVLTGTEPIKVVGRGTGIDDAGWMRKCAAVRDARRRAWPHRDDPARLLAAAGGADLAAMTGFLLQATLRRTPVLLDGLVVSAAALVAQLATPRMVQWLRAAHLSAEPAHELALRRLELVPILRLGMRLGEGTGALVALPVLRAATLTLARMATFDEAAVTDRERPGRDPREPGAEPCTERAGRWAAGARLALTTLTVLPLRAGRVDRPSAALAMAGAPVVGLALGAVLAVAARALTAAGLGPLPAAAVLVTLLALLTRGLHLDGLADTFDGLGSYAPPDRALAIMKSPEAGPLGVSAVVLALLADAAALSALVARHGWLLIAVAVAVGRFGITLCCARPVPAARPEGLGALVAGTVAGAGLRRLGASARRAGGARRPAVTRRRLGGLDPRTAGGAAGRRRGGAAGPAVRPPVRRGDRRRAGSVLRAGHRGGAAGALRTLTAYRYRRTAT